jgi:hypothetical protein
MGGCLADLTCGCGACRMPTKDDVYRAAIKWCGDKERETFPEDIAYFEHNWSALPGLRAYVEREVSSLGETDA